MPKYRTRGAQLGSQYTNDSGVVFSPTEELGGGSYANARLFESETGEKIIVLAPNPNNNNYTRRMEEAQTKEEFFKELYPDGDTHLFKDEDLEKGEDNTEKSTYRLTVPPVPGQSYYESTYFPMTDREQILFFKSAVDALMVSHNKRKVVVDLSSNNIFYDSKTGISYLIDGGLSATEGQPINEQFNLPDMNTLRRCKNNSNFSNYAPECWTVREKGKNTGQTAQKSMDIYSLGVLMDESLNDKILKIETDEGEIQKRTSAIPVLQKLIKDCKNIDPGSRPTIEKIQNKLNKLLQSKDETATINQNEEENLNCPLISEKLEDQLNALNYAFSDAEIQILLKSKPLQNLISDFLDRSNSIVFKDAEKREAFETYKVETIQLILKGKTSFEKEYLKVATKAYLVIKDDKLTKFAHAMGNFIVTSLAAISIGGIIGMLASKPSRGQFLLFKSKADKFAQNSLVLEEHHKVLHKQALPKKQPAASEEKQDNNSLTT